MMKINSIPIATPMVTPNAIPVLKEESDSRDELGFSSIGILISEIFTGNVAFSSFISEIIDSG